MGRLLLSICALVVAVGLTGASPPQAPNPNPLYAACEKGEANRQSDLCAQWYAADSAQEASIWSRRTGWFTGLGLVVGAVTMVAAIFAALFAKNAAEHTKRGADIAEKAWLGMERPFIIVEVTGQRKTGGAGLVFPVEYILANVGRVPATLIHIAHRVEVVEDANGLPEPLSLEERRGRKVPAGEVVAPDGRTEPNLGGPALAGEIDGLEITPPAAVTDAFVKRTFFHGYVVYGDLAQRRYVSGFCFDSRHGAKFTRTGHKTNLYNYDRPLAKGERVPYEAD